jgi:drug/metabolite transporter (DMT)-like permease
MRAARVKIPWSKLSTDEWRRVAALALVVIGVVLLSAPGALPGGRQFVALAVMAAGCVLHMTALRTLA